MKRVLRFLCVVAVLALALTGCTGGSGAAGRDRAGGGDQPGAAPGDTLTVYSRDREFAEPLFTLFEQQTGITIRARWGDPITLAKQILADGDASPADVFYAPLSDSLGTLSAAGRLATLSDRQLRQVPAAYRSPDATWVGTSGRAHVVFYNTDQLSDDDLPDSILGFTDPAWRGRIGWDPTSRSLRDVITELRQLDGEDTARAWLRGIRANTPAAFQGALPIIDAVAAGTLIQVGFGSHSYLYYRQAHRDAGNVAAKFYPGGKPGGLLNVAGVGILKHTANRSAADAFVDFMLSPTAQRYIAEHAYEIPLVAGIRPPAGIPTAEQLAVPGLDPRQFEDLRDARRLLTDVGIIR
jgi:iron(III) transport system substrate-binding protein